MNWPIIILDGLSMSLLFNAVAGLGFLLVPQAYSSMFPKEIRQAAARATGPGRSCSWDSCFFSDAWIIGGYGRCTATTLKTKKNSKRA